MRESGRSTFSVDESGWCLDRWAGLESVITLARIRHALAQPLPLDPDRLSFTSCFRVLKCRLPECQPPTTHSFADWHAALIEELQDEQLPAPRRHRINPRVIKRKMSKWPKKRDQHKSPPRLNKPFADTIVMAN